MTYPNLTLPQMLAQSAAAAPDAAALAYFGNRISYRQLLEHVNRVAAGLQGLGLQKGDRVALMMPNCPQFVIAYFGVLRAGGIVTATSSMYTTREAVHQWNDAGVKFVIADRRLAAVVQTSVAQAPSVQRVIFTGMKDYFPAQFRRMNSLLAVSPPTPVKTATASAGPATMEWRQLLAASAQPAPDGLTPADIACLQYTGGTTGVSKGAMLTHANLVINAHQANHWLTVGEIKPEVLVAALPMFHIFAMTCVMICGVLAGAMIVILPRFELRAALNVIRKFHPTIFHGVPTMYVAFNGVPDIQRYGFHSLRMCMSGGAGLPVEVRQKFESITGGKLVEGYGLTETSPVTHINPPSGSPKKGSMGLPIADTEARIVDLDTGTREMPVGEVGEIVIRGPQVMRGYWNKPEETALVLRDGWFHTGDIAKKDEDGYFYIVDRKKDMIIAGGFNIYPREVEEVLFEHPKIQEAGVVGVPDTYRGETVKAFVVVKKGMTLTADEVVAFCRERLAAYKVPRQVAFIDALPRSGVGKYLRRELKKL